MCLFICLLYFGFQDSLFVFWQYDFNVSRCGFLLIYSTGSPLPFVFYVSLLVRLKFLNCFRLNQQLLYLQGSRKEIRRRVGKERVQLLRDLQTMGQRTSWCTQISPDLVCLCTPRSEHMHLAMEPQRGLPFGWWQIAKIICKDVVEPLGVLFQVSISQHLLSISIPGTVCWAQGREDKKNVRLGPQTGRAYRILSVGKIAMLWHK